MSEYTQDQIYDGILQRFLGGQTDDVFDDVELRKLGEKFRIDAPLLDDFCMLLNVGAVRNQITKKGAEVDWATVNAELAEVANTATPKLDALSNLGAGTQTALIDSGFWRSVANAPSPAIIEQHSSTDGSQHLTLHSDAIKANAPQEIDFAALSEIQSAISSVAQNAQLLVPKGRGRKQNEAVFELIFWSFHAWTSVGKKPFKVRWLADSAPNSTTADYLKEVAALVDSKITPQQIVTAGRKVRKKCKPLKNLQELPEFVQNCCETLL